MTLQLPFPSFWVATTERDEYAQRLAVARRISGIRWLCIVAGVVACRSHSFVSVAVFVAVALYNVLPSFYAARSTLPQLRRFGKVLLVLDGVALLFASLPLVARGEYPVPFVLLFFAASIRLGYEPPRVAAVGMAATTIVGVGIGLLPLLRGDYVQDAFLWTLLCVFLGWRGAVTAQTRWRERQKLWAQPFTTPPPEMATENDAQRAVGAVGSPASAVGETPPNSLTAREREVLIGVAQGMTNDGIAKALSISPKTVGTHVESVSRKLQACNRTRAVVIALERGWISFPVNTPERENETAMSPQSSRNT